MGRSRDADIRINDRRISAEHAVILWNRGRWEVKDLGSRNGTAVDGKRLAPGTRRALSVGSSLRFGNSDLCWILDSDDGPDVLAFDLEMGEILQGEQGLLRWDAGSLIYTENGAEYWLELDGEKRPIIDRQVVEIGGRRWRISIPDLDESGETVTVDGALLSHDVKLQFQVSPDQEHIQLRVMAHGTCKDLRSRSFDYMLLALARARISDAATGELPPEEQGWVYADELASALGMDVGHINVDIYRARRRFASAGIQGAEDMLERRAQTRAVRLGCGSVELI